jgi:hypothetical protein
VNEPRAAAKPLLARCDNALAKRKLQQRQATRALLHLVQNGINEAGLKPNADGFGRLDNRFAQLLTRHWPKVLNVVLKRAAARFGFTFEGVFRQHMIVKGRNRDTAWFSMLDSEWPARRAAFERWLDPANFDAEGRQQVSLTSLNAG